MEDLVRKVIFLVGLPGSGKTYLGRQMSGLFLDDICQTCGTGRLKEKFHTETVLVADPSLCRPVNRKLAEKMVKVHHPNCEVEWIFFANDPEQCLKNVRVRNDERLVTERTIERISRDYFIPEGAIVHEVWKC